MARTSGRGSSIWRRTWAVFLAIAITCTTLVVGGVYIYGEGNETIIINGSIQANSSLIVLVNASIGDTLTVPNIDGTNFTGNVNMTTHNISDIDTIVNQERLNLFFGPAHRFIFNDTGFYVLSGTVLEMTNASGNSTITLNPSTETIRTGNLIATDYVNADMMVVTHNITTNNLFVTDIVVPISGSNSTCIVSEVGDIEFICMEFEEFNETLFLTDVIFDSLEADRNYTTTWIDTEDEGTITFETEGGYANFSGDVIAANIFLPQHIFSHTNVSMAVGSAGVWYNITFDEQADEVIEGIQHTYDDGTNNTFYINQDGIYAFDWSISFFDSSAAQKHAVVTRIAVDGVEINGSVFEKDTNLQNAYGTINHDILADLSAGDEINIQFTSDSTDVTLATLCTYGTHCDSATLSIHKISN